MYFLIPPVVVSRPVLIGRGFPMNGLIDISFAICDCRTNCTYKPFNFFLKAHQTFVSNILFQCSRVCPQLDEVSCVFTRFACTLPVDLCLCLLQTVRPLCSKARILPEYTSRIRSAQTPMLRNAEQSGASLNPSFKGI